MQILASALPGFRDLRAPLTAGYLWLILLWIWLKPDLAVRPSNGIAAAVYDLGNVVGPIWIGLGVSVAAYLIGSITQLGSEFIRSGYRFAFNRESAPYKFEYSNNQELIRLAESAHPIDKLTREASIKLLRAGLHPEHDAAEIKSIEQNITQRSRMARKGLHAELELPATLLLGNETQLFTEADRLKAESDLRFAVALPLSGIILFLTVSSSLWWMLAFIAIAALIAQGIDRDKEFGSLMESSVIRGTVRSDAVQAFNLWVSNLPPDGEPPKAARP
ncbi:hypothetical protein [Mycolicibacterium iranicum]|uniref:DUF4239 domain-containing protein n=1 Tax=Mycolicibacterium iranicum TaxID=912594 RepID=A0ABT4HP68_MYCIR|nr:hypothetical protein [Mycolicibacterium iranicum]MCZ0731869.1 hypothetical protein [Mycolicibacterium iranicum]